MNTIHELIASCDISSNKLQHYVESDIRLWHLECRERKIKYHSFYPIFSRYYDFLSVMGQEKTKPLLYTTESFNQYVEYKIMNVSAPPMRVWRDMFLEEIEFHLDWSNYSNFVASHIVNRTYLNALKNIIDVRAKALDDPYKLVLGSKGLIRTKAPKSKEHILTKTLLDKIKGDPDGSSEDEIAWKRLLKNSDSLQQTLGSFHQSQDLNRQFKTLWNGRFASSLATETIAFTHSTETDTRLVGYDIWGSQAHAIMLARQGIISDADLRVILHWLQKAEKDFQNGGFTLDPNKEDVHMNVESYLIENTGREFGGKLHTARSRNDQVLVDTHLYIRDEILNIQRGLSELCDAFLQIAKAHADTVMPGYTHTQHAQPISLGFWATAYVSMFLRDQKRLQSAYALANTNPLGACALAGTTFPIDRELTTKLLGFDAPHEHALDVISSRDFIAETLFALSLVMANLSRISEEIVYWTTYEFGIAVLDDAYSFGSSIMPQKKNPDIAELTRGRTGRVYGALLDLLTNLKGLPMGYNRDFQEDKPPLWEAFDIVNACLGLLPELLKTTDFKTERMAELANANFATATELANYLVKEHQLSFRECHEIVGWVVGELVKQEKTFSNWELTQKLLKQKEIDIPISQLKRILDAELAIQNNQSLGGTSPTEVHRMIENFEKQLGEIALHVYNSQTQIEDAHGETLRIIDEFLRIPVIPTEGEWEFERQIDRRIGYR